MAVICSRGWQHGQSENGHIAALRGNAWITASYVPLYKSPETPEEGDQELYFIYLFIITKNLT